MGRIFLEIVFGILPCWTGDFIKLLQTGQKENDFVQDTKMRTG